LGEENNRIFVIGSPDIDIMMSDRLPSLKEAKNRYEIPFDDYGILMYHPVTTEYTVIGSHIKAVVDAAIGSNRHFIVIYPNNDLGSEVILNEYRRLENNPNFRVFPSMRFEHFLTILKHAEFIIGNSSAGIRESGIYGIPAIDIGTRQSGRYSVTKSKNIQHVSEDVDEILDAIGRVNDFRRISHIFGDGNSTEAFYNIISDEEFWNIDIQKHFVDYDF
jgi:UDP-N-acetylglucosamine 2-epimerase (hydrolysing)